MTLMDKRPGAPSGKRAPSLLQVRGRGDLAYNGLLSKVVACHPDFVVVLLGGNDVMASMPK